MRLLVIIILLFNTAFAQQPFINVRLAPFNSPTGNVLDAQPAIQAAIDSAVEVNGIVYIPNGIYRLDAPLMIYKWDGTDYQPCTIKIVGDDAMWSPTVTRLFPSFKDRFGIGVQRGYGVTIDKIYLEGDYNQSLYGTDTIYRAPANFNGDPSCRNSRYSPFAGFVIDPFSYSVPPDGGYPGMTSWYRGTTNANGSKGVKITNSSSTKFVVGFLTSPNGVTRDADNLVFKNLRCGGGLVAFSGSQLGEKNNRIVNVGIWGIYRYAFAWGMYGAQEQGHWICSEYNIAQAVADIVWRDSRKGDPMFLEDGFSESLGRYGEWNAVNDAAWNLSTNLLGRTSGFTNGYCTPIMSGKGVSIFNTKTRYYGAFTDPVIISNSINEFYNAKALGTYYNILYGQYTSQPNASWAYNYGYTLSNQKTFILNWYDSANVRYARVETSTPYTVADQIIITNLDSSIVGQAYTVKSIAGAYFIIGQISPFVANNTAYRFFKFNNTTIASWRPNGTAND